MREEGSVLSAEDELVFAVRFLVLDSALVPGAGLSIREQPSRSFYF
jgi:hypothetical protein